MKKMLAVILALILALSCGLTAAEETDAAEWTAFTAIGETKINQEALSNLLSSLGMDPELGGVLPMVMPLLSNLKEKVTYDGTALQLDIMLKDTAVATVAGRQTEGNWDIMCNLIPNYKLTLQGETVTNMLQKLGVQGEEGAVSVNTDPQVLLAELEAIVAKYQETLNATITMGEPELGEFEYRDIVFNVMTPAEVDVRALSLAVANITKELLNNETVMNALSTVGQFANVDVNSLNDKIAEIENMPDEELPDMTVYIFSILKDGEVLEEPTLISLDVDTKKEEDGVVVVNLFTSAEMLSLDLTQEAAETSAALAFNIADPANLFSLYVKTPGAFVGLKIGMEDGEATVFNGELYFMDSEKPLISEIVTLIPEGKVTANFDGEGKTAVALEELMESSDGKAGDALMNDLQVNGVGILLTNAMMAMPEEMSAIMTLMMGGTATEEAPVVEEVPAVEEAVEEAPAANE